MDEVMMVEGILAVGGAISGRGVPGAVSRAWSGFDRMRMEVWPAGPR